MENDKSVMESPKTPKNKETSIKGISVIDKNDGFHCQIVSFYPKCSRLLVWKSKMIDFGCNGGNEEVLGLHVRDVEGGEETLKEIGIWDSINQTAKDEITGAVVEVKQARVEAIKRGHEARRNYKRECMSPLQLMDEKIKIRVKEVMDEKYPNRPKGRPSPEISAYRKEVTERITKEVKKEMKEKE